LANTVARFRKAGVLVRNGDAATKSTTAKTKADDESTKRKEKAEADQRERIARTKVIRERIETLVVKMGGWDKRGTQSALAGAFYTFSHDNDFKVPSSRNSSQMMVHTLRRGQTLSAESADVWEAFLNTIEAKDDPVAQVLLLHGEKDDGEEKISATPTAKPEASSLSEEETVKRILEYAESGKSRVWIARQLFGDEGKRKEVAAVIKEAKRSAEQETKERRPRGPASEESVAYCAAVRARLLPILEKLDGKQAQRHMDFWKNGNELTRPGDPYPGDNGKTELASAIMGSDHVRKVAKGDVKTIMEKFRPWWDRNLADYEERFGLAETPTEPVVEPEPEPETEPAAAEPEEVADQPVLLTIEEIREELKKWRDEIYADLDVRHDDPEPIGPLVAAELASIPPRAISEEETPTLALEALERMVPRSGAIEVARKILMLEINALLAGEEGEKE
jgi:hypothetical protein